MKDGTTAFTTSTPGTSVQTTGLGAWATSYVLAANENWFGEHTPYLDSVEVTGISAVTTRLDGLLAGKAMRLSGWIRPLVQVSSSNAQTKYS